MSFDVKFDKAALMGAVDKQAASLVRYAARVCAGEVKRSMADDPKTGRVYTRPGGRKHQASAPGEAPAIDFKRLYPSIGFDVEQTSKGWQSVVGSRMPKAIWRMLEFGTQRIAPRPSARPAFYFALGKLREVMREKRIIGGVTGTVGKDLS